MKPLTALILSAALCLFGWTEPHAQAIYPFYPAGSNTVTAAGVAQGTATPLTYGSNTVTGIQGAGVILPKATGTGFVVTVYITAPQFLVVYPNIGGQILDFGTNTGYAAYPQNYIQFIDSGANQWGMSNNLPFNFPIFVSRTASQTTQGGTIASDQLGYGSNIITSCVLNGVSLLPIATGGTEAIWVTNVCGSPIVLFSQVSGFLNNTSNGSIPLPNNATVILNDIGPVSGHNTWVDAGAKAPLSLGSIAGTCTAFNPGTCPNVQTIGNSAADISIGAFHLGAPLHGDSYNSLLDVAAGGDLIYESPAVDPFFFFQCTNNTATQICGYLLQNDDLGVNTFPGLLITAKANTNCQTDLGVAPTPTVTSTGGFGCTEFDISRSWPLIETTHSQFITRSISPTVQYFAIGEYTPPIKWAQISSSSSTQATTTIGDTNATSITNIQGGSAANTQANGTPIATVLRATSGSIGGGALGAGACTTGTVAVTSSTTAMTVAVAPVADPGTSVTWEGFVSVAGTVTVRVCALVALTPTATTYNVRVFP